MIKDKEIRIEFIKRNIEFFKSNIFVNEFGVNHTNVVDLASFDFNNNIFYGFEIKSEADNLKRLKKQLKAYITFFHIVYVIIFENHLEDTMKLLNSTSIFKNVGVIKVDSELNFIEVKRGHLNKISHIKMLNNLDIEEIFNLCEKYNIPKNRVKEDLESILMLKIRENSQEIYDGIKDKLKKYYIKECEKCHSHLYYNKIMHGYKVSYCYECGSPILDI